MRAFEAQTAIQAPPDLVWSILSDVAKWPAWDSGVTKVVGRAAVGEKLTVTVAANPGRSFPVKVTHLDAPKLMVFHGGMPFGLFIGQRIYTLAAEPDGCRFTMREEYSGPLAGLIFKSIPDLTASFQQFAAGLKKLAEDRSASS